MLFQADGKREASFSTFAQILRMFLRIFTSWKDSIQSIFDADDLFEVAA